MRKDLDPIFMIENGGGSSCIGGGSGDIEGTGLAIHGGGSGG